METRTVQLRIHQTNIDRYENMLKTVLTDLERQFVQKRVSEERLAIAMLMNAPKGTIFALERIGVGNGLACLSDF